MFKLLIIALIVVACDCYSANFVNCYEGCNTRYMLYQGTACGTDFYYDCMNKCLCLG